MCYADNQKLSAKGSKKTIVLCPDAPLGVITHALTSLASNDDIVSLSSFQESVISANAYRCEVVVCDEKVQTHCCLIISMFFKVLFS